MKASQYRPRAGYYASFAVYFAICGAVAMTLGLSLPLTLIPLGLCISASTSQRLTLSAKGVTYGWRSADWERLKLRHTRWGDWLRTERSSFLPGGLAVNLRSFDTRWRSREIGNDIRRWAPTVLPE